MVIITKYLGPTNNRGSRIKASCYNGSITVPYCSRVDGLRCHFLAVEALVKKLNIKETEWHANFDGINNAGYIFTSGGTKLISLNAILNKKNESEVN